MSGDNFRYFAGQRQGVRALVGGVGIGEMLADVTQGRCAQHGVHHCVQQHIGVGMAQQAFLVGDLYPA